MNPSTSHTSAEHAGRCLGHLSRRLMQLHNVGRRVMMQAGLPSGAANLIVAAVWVLIAAVFVRHYSVWIAVVGAIAIVLTLRGLSNVTNDVPREPEWRQGYSGFGRYDRDGYRVDPYDPEKLP